MQMDTARLEEGLRQAQEELAKRGVELHAINSMLTHEINQPLQANSSKCPRGIALWLSNERPNCDEARCGSEGYRQCWSPCRGDSQKPPFDIHERKPKRSMTQNVLEFPCRALLPISHVNPKFAA